MHLGRKRGPSLDVCICVGQAAGLQPLVDYSKKKAAEVHLDELKSTLVDMITSDPPLPVGEVVAAVKAKKVECQLADQDIIKVCSVVSPNTT
jgi:hypothetical protein